VGRLAVFILAFLTWLSLTWTLDTPSVVIGVFAAIIASAFFGRLVSVSFAKILNPVRWFWFLVYIPVFLWEMIKANLDVAYRVLSPRLPINPGIVKIKTKLKSELAQTVLANSITLTPGTMSVDIKGDNLFVHWIDVKHHDVEGASSAIAGRFEKILARVFE